MRAIVLVCLLEVVFIRAVEPQDSDSLFNWDVLGQPTNTVACLSNPESCGCCLMQDWIKESENLFMYKVNDLKEELAEAEMILDHVTANRSVFSVSLNNAETLECFGTFRNDKIITYSHIFINPKNHYNMSTGIYTAPCSGTYSFSLTIYSRTIAGTNVATCADLVVNNSVVSHISETSGQDIEDSSTTVITTKLQVGDRVSVILPTGCAICDNKNHHNTFTGFLLYADYIKTSGH